ncbi:MAG: sulfotransferase domain-containing protein [Planctomycetota bacterium]
MEGTRFFSLTGFMKSGTNWLGSLLSTHEDITVIGEFHWQAVYAAAIKNFNLFPAYHDEGFQKYVLGQLDQVVKSSLKAHCWPPPKVIGERTPRTIAPVIMRDSPIISIVRDGRDVIVSRAFHLYNEPGFHRLFERVPEMRADLENFENDKWYFQKNPHRLLCHEVMVRESVRWWVDHLESDRETIASNPDLRVMTVRYEDLHHDVESERRKLFDFLDVDPLRADEVSGSLKPGFQKERPDQFFRKGQVGDWKNYFDDHSRGIFNDIAGEELIRQGYASSLDW